MARIKGTRSVYRFIVKTFLVSTLLLVVAAIFFPMFARSRECSRCGPYCASNMKRLGLGFIQYTQDYDEKYPSGSDHWAGATYSYEKSTGVYHCPEDTVAWEPASNPSLHRISYGMNANLLLHTDADLTDPSYTVLACDIDGTPLCDFVNGDDASQYTTGWTPNSAWGGIRLGTTATTLNPPRHDPGLEFLACDGHVTMLRPEKVSSGIDNLSWSGQQDAVHAAGTKALAARGYTLTFSER